MRASQSEASQQRTHALHLGRICTTALVLAVIHPLRRYATHFSHCSVGTSAQWFAAHRKIFWRIVKCSWRVTDRLYSQSTAVTQSVKRSGPKWRPWRGTCVVAALQQGELNWAQGDSGARKCPQNEKHRAGGSAEGIPCSEGAQHTSTSRS